MVSIAGCYHLFRLSVLSPPPKGCCGLFNAGSWGWAALFATSANGVWRCLGVWPSRPCVLYTGTVWVEVKKVYIYIYIYIYRGLISNWVQLPYSGTYSGTNHCQLSWKCIPGLFRFILGLFRVYSAIEWEMCSAQARPIPVYSRSIPFYSGLF